LEDSQIEIQNVILEVTKVTLNVLQNLYQCEMDLDVGGQNFQQLLYYKVSKVVLLETSFEYGCNLQLDCAVVCDFHMQENLPTRQKKRIESLWPFIVLIVYMFAIVIFYTECYHVCWSASVKIILSWLF